MTQQLVDGEPVDYSRFPTHLKPEMEGYIEFGREPGKFLLAVLSNDLIRACMYAELCDKGLVHLYAYWLYHCAPPKSYGSRENVVQWMEARQRENVPKAG